MSRTLTISDELYEELESDARRHGLTVEQMLARRVRDTSLLQRERALDHASRLQEEFSAKYGKMPDSAALIREDRGR